MRGCSIPGKVFLLGEYLVRKTGEALVTTLAPRFQCGVSLIKAGSLEEWQGPCAWLKTKVEEEGFLESLRFEDPYPVKGGVGASTARFIGAAWSTQKWELKASDVSWVWALWSLYRQLHQERLAPAFWPSGADLVAQCIGGTTVLHLFQQSVRFVVPQVDYTQLLIFSGAHLQKVKTHEHLQSLIHDVDVSKLQQIFQDGLGYLSDKEFGDALYCYGEELARLGLEHERTTFYKKQFRSIPGVLGVKGSGALQLDLLLVMAKESAFSEVKHQAAQLGLYLLGDHLSYEPGLQEWSQKHASQ